VACGGRRGGQVGRFDGYVGWRDFWCACGRLEIIPPSLLSEVLGLDRCKSDYAYLFLLFSFLLLSRS
jgi:hypothetical protein